MAVATSLLFDPRFDLVTRGAPPASTLVADFMRGMLRPPRSIPPKHIYDAVGSDLFDRICDLPEYYLTRAEQALLEEHAKSIVDETRAEALLELGSGMARKTAPLLAAICGRARHPVYAPLDISSEAIEASSTALLARFGGLYVRGVVGEFPRDLARFDVAAPPEAPRLFAFLGSTIGNLDDAEAPALLRAVAASMRAEDAFLLGVDLVKDARTLEAAYDDSRGVTALFTKNVLTVMNRELATDFDLPGFDHQARWIAERERMEMHLAARRTMRINVRRLALSIVIEEGERVLAEISRKFTRASAERMLAQGGMRLARWIEAPGVFALAVAKRS